jgi:hypothetical protein
VRKMAVGDEWRGIQSGEKVLPAKASSMAHKKSVATECVKTYPSAPVLEAASSTSGLH